MHQQVMYFCIPDTLVHWPWPRRLNPHYAEVAPASNAWVNSFHALEGKGQRAFNRCDFGLLTSLAYPLANKELLRSCCDMMNAYFVIDDYTDEADGPTAQYMADIVMDALRNPYKSRPQGEPPLGEICRQFWYRALERVKPSAEMQRRFVDTFDSYMQAVVTQAEDRDFSRVRTINEYLIIRRHTVATLPSFAMNEIGLDIPEDVLDNPVLEDMRLCATDMISIDNDLYSYNVEQARGDDAHNVVTVAMHSLQTDLLGAIAWVDSYHTQLAEQFLKDVDDLPCWGEDIDSRVRVYVDALGNWVRANEAWSFESQRYFGSEGPSIHKHRKVKLLPKRD